MNNQLIQEIQEAEKRIRRYILKTPLLESLYISQVSKAHVFLKLESEQYTGSFKIRGATNKVILLTAEEKKRGVITASTGNHGQALARACQKAGIS